MRDTETRKGVHRPVDPDRLAPVMRQTPRNDEKGATAVGVLRRKGEATR